jgi:hypothetical protein
VTDPLRPFAQIIRSLWRGRAPAAQSSSSTSQTGSPPEPAPRVDESLQSRLSAQIAGIDTANAARLRQAFVETVLLWELGEQLARDPEFAQMVSRVSEQLGSDAAVAQNLHGLLVKLAADRRG